MAFAFLFFHFFPNKGKKTVNAIDKQVKTC